jgi:5,10-methylenetetrahydromethanopterin reductase
MYGSIDDDESRAIEAARPIAAWFPQTAPQYCDLAGMDAELVANIRTRYRGGEFQEASDAAALISDELVQEFALAGDRGAATAKVEMLVAKGVRNLAIFPLGERRMETVREFARGVLPAFADNTV